MIDVGGGLTAVRNSVRNRDSSDLVFLAILVLVYFGVDYDLGFTHHYDVSSRLSEVERLRKMDPDSSQSARVDSLYEGIIAEMETREETLIAELPSIYESETYDWIGITFRVLCAAGGYIVYFIYAVYKGKELEPEGQRLGSFIFVIGMSIVGLIFPSIMGIGGTAIALVAVQFMSAVALSRWGNSQ